MATTRSGFGDRTEICEACGRPTPHVITIELRIEGTDPETAKFSREPYRNTECQVCGEAVSVRMNNA